MTRPAWHFIVDVVMLVAFLGLLFTAGLVEFVFPPGTRAQGWSVWGFDYDAWSRARLVCLALFTIMVVVHLILQWSWVCNFITNRINKATGRKGKLPDGIKTLYGVGTLIAVLGGIGGLIAIAAITVHTP